MNFEFSVLGNCVKNCWSVCMIDKMEKVLIFSVIVT